MNHNPALSPAWALILPSQPYTLSPSPSQDKGPCNSVLSQAGRWVQMGSNSAEGKKQRDVKMAKFSLVIKYQHTGSTKRWAGTWNRAGSLWARHDSSPVQRGSDNTAIGKSLKQARQQSPLQSGTERHFGILQRAADGIIQRKKEISYSCINIYSRLSIHWHCYVNTSSFKPIHQFHYYSDWTVLSTCLGLETLQHFSIHKARKVKAWIKWRITNSHSFLMSIFLKHISEPVEKKKT